MSGNYDIAHGILDAIKPGQKLTGQDFLVMAATAQAYATLAPVDAMNRLEENSRPAGYYGGGPR